MIPDVSKPIENPKLSALLRELHSALPDRAQALCEAVAEELATNAYLLAVFQADDDAIEHTGEGKAVFRKDSKLNFPFISQADGTAFLPVYTDWEALRKCEACRTGDVRTMVLSFDDMAALTAGTRGIVVNPYSESFVLHPEAVTHMKQRKEQQEKGYFACQVQEETTVKIGTPQELPPDFADSVLQCAREQKAIDALWIKLMKRGGEISYLLVIDAAGDPAPLFQRIVAAASPHLPKGTFLDMVPYSDPFGKKAATGKPFYRRKRGLFR